METVDILYAESINLIQAKDGYRFSLDPVLLADFVTLRGGESVLDLGTGCGVLPQLLVRRSAGLRVVGWERQSQMVERARRGVVLSGMGEQVTIVEADLREYPSLAEAGSFDLVVSNPPYRTLRSGRIAPIDERAAARHELAGGLDEFLAAASWCLKCGGCFAIVYLAERLNGLLAGMARVGIEPKRLRMVHARQGAVSKMVLVEGRKRGAPGLKVESPLFIYTEDRAVREYTAEVLRIYARDGATDVRLQ